MQVASVEMIEVAAIVVMIEVSYSYLFDIYIYILFAGGFRGNDRGGFRGGRGGSGPGTGRAPGDDSVTQSIQHEPQLFNLQETTGINVPPKEVTEVRTNAYEINVAAAKMA